jgi:hypothetical protein
MLHSSLELFHLFGAWSLASFGSALAIQLLEQLKQFFLFSEQPFGLLLLALFEQHGCLFFDFLDSKFDFFWFITEACGS